jgi:hypothetical protein
MMGDQDVDMKDPTDDIKPDSVSPAAAVGTNDAGTPKKNSSKKAKLESDVKPNSPASSTVVRTRTSPGMSAPVGLPFASPAPPIAVTDNSMSSDSGPAFALDGMSPSKRTDCDLFANPTLVSILAFCFLDFLFSDKLADMLRYVVRHLPLITRGYSNRFYVARTCSADYLAVVEIFFLDWHRTFAGAVGHHIPKDALDLSYSQLTLVDMQALIWRAFLIMTSLKDYDPTVDNDLFDPARFAEYVNAHHLPESLGELIIWFFV